MPASISCAHRRGQRRAVAHDRRLEAEPFARGHDGDAVAADIAAQHHRVAGPHLLRRDRLAAPSTSPTPGGVDVEAVALAALDDLGVAGDEPHAGRRGRVAHRGDDAAQIVDRQTLLEDQPDAQIERLGAAHRQVVDRAVDGERADVAAGKEQRPHDIGIGREGQPRAADVEHGAVMREIVRRCRRRPGGRALDQPVRQQAAAAMGELDRVVRLRPASGS